MKAVLDTSYRAGDGFAACVAFTDWRDGRPREIWRAISPVRAAYRAGRFLERELPCLLTVLEASGQRFETIVVDGYVHLKPEIGKGLGRALFEALGKTTPVIGVAKTPLTIAAQALPIYRGHSRRPLFVSAAGHSPRRAADLIVHMHGPYRIPTLLRLADRQARRAQRRCQP